MLNGTKHGYGGIHVFRIDQNRIELICFVSHDLIGPVLDVHKLRSVRKRSMITPDSVVETGNMFHSKAMNELCKYFLVDKCTFPCSLSRRVSSRQRTAKNTEHEAFVRNEKGGPGWRECNSLRRKDPLFRSTAKAFTFRYSSSGGFYKSFLVGNLEFEEPKGCKELRCVSKRE